ncbi:MAG: right-handed parallel beta-helix repeat-containing protein, partial [Thermoplasmata archaeon]
MIRKIVAVWVILAMLAGFVVILDVVTYLTPPVRAAIITVDDSGGADYLTIQEAIDGANPGDTIFVSNGTYYENVVVNKTINLIGEDKNSTIIDAGGIGKVINISAEWVNITGFTIMNSGTSGYPDDNAGLKLWNTQNCCIESNNLVDNWFGIDIQFSNDNIVKSNNISNNLYGIYVWFSLNSHISNNNILFNDQVGIRAAYSPMNNITHNNVSHNHAGITLHFPSHNSSITYNNVSNNGYGISVGSSSNNSIVVCNLLLNNSIGFSLSSSYTTITHNVISFSNYKGLSIQGSSNNNIITDNTVSNTNHEGIYLDGIQMSRTRPFENVLFGLGIRYVGKTVAEKLAQHFRDIDHIKEASYEALI